MSIKETLQAAAIQIRDERKLEANTAKRVGALLLALVEADLNMEDLEKSFLSRLKEDEAAELINFVKGLKINGSIINHLLSKDTEVEEVLDTDIMSALRVMDEINENNENLKKLFLSRLDKDEAAGHITFKNGSSVENGLIVRLPKQTTTAALMSCLLEEDIDTLVEEDEDAVMEIADISMEGATTLGGMSNVDSSADTSSKALDILVRLAEAEVWIPASLLDLESFKCVGTTDDRDNIPVELLRKGMLCYVNDLDLFYRYNGAVWEEKVLGSGSSSSVQRNVRIANDLDSKNLSASKGDPCYLEFTFVSQERYSDDDPYEDTGERGLCQISIKNAVNAEYTVVKQQWINSGVSSKIDIAEYLTSGANQVMVKVTGEVTEVTTPSFVYLVQLTSLSIDASNFKWWTAYSGNITIPLNIGGNVSKTLNVTISGDGYNESYQVPLGDTVYIDTAYNYSLLHPARSGVFLVSAYVANADGTIKTKTISYNIICIVSGATDKFIAINNVLAKATNWAENALFDYTMYDGGDTTTAAQFVVKKAGISVYTSDENSITTSTKYTLSIPLEIETLDNSDFEIVAQILDDNSELVPAMTFPVNNSLGYSAIAGAAFYMNPKTRSNSQSNRLSIVNEITGSLVSGTWEGMNWGNDGWQADESGNKVLRMQADSLLTINYQPFSKECARTGKTIEIDYKIDNVTDYSEPVITISTPSGDSFVGLNIYADDIVMYSQALRKKAVQSLHTFEGKRTRLTLTIIPDAYGNSEFNLCNLYINGIKNRQFVYANNDYFSQSGNIVIGSDYADVDVYGIRIYDSGLTSQGVQTNYMNWLPTTEEKAAFKEVNDILDANGSEIDFENTKRLYNVYVYDNIIPSMADQSSRLGTLEVFFVDHPEWNVSISNVTSKGQGTSSMKYWIWNTRFQLDKATSVITHADGTTSTKKWQMVPFLPAGQKFTSKKNYASSMQSHKIGAVNSYTDLYKAMELANEAMVNDDKVRVSVYEMPFFCFEKSVNEEGKTVYTFRGLYTFGPDKGDKYTFGFDTDTFPNMISIEGSDNSPLLTLFRVPWNSLGRILYNEDEEAYQYNGQNSWDFGEGEVDNISHFIPAYNFVYECSPRLKPFNGTVAELNAQVAIYKNEPYEFWIAKAGDANQYGVYYYESSENSFVASDIGGGAINLRTQLSDYLADDLSVFTADQLNELFVNARVQRFRSGVGQYWDVNDTLFFMNNVEFNAGTDERAKNTYPYSFCMDGSTFKWRVDDADTRFDTTNRGLPEKSYSVETHDVDETGAAIWNGETNNFFNLMELAFVDEKVASMRKMLTAMQTLGELKSGNDLEKLYAFYQKYYFDQAQEYFPAVAYNADAKYCYENGKLALENGQYSNDTDPITQSLGDHYLAEQRWITKRILYMMSKYSFGLFSANGTDTITVRAAGNIIGYDLTPAMDMYPAISNGTSIIRGSRTKAGEVCHMDIELSGSGDQQNAIMGASYLKDIGDWHNKNVTGSMIVQGRMLVDIRLGHATEPIVISINALTLSNCVSLQRLILSRIATLAGTLNLMACTHLKEVYAGGTSLAQILLPKGGGLEVIEYSELNQYITLQNYPLLKSTGVLMDYCREKISDFLVEGCPLLNPMDLLSAIIEAQQSQGVNHALKHIRAVGFDVEYYTADALDMLANLADGSYEGLSAEGIAGEDPIPVLDGKITVHSKYYQDFVDSLRNTFDRLELILEGEPAIYIADKYARTFIVSVFDTDNDGYVTAEEAAIERQLYWDRYSDANKVQIADLRELNAIEGSPSQLTNIKEYYMGYRNTETGNQMFYLNTSIEILGIGTNVVKVSQRTCRGCTNLKKVILNDKVEILYGDPFRDCVALTEISDIPDTCYEIGGDCFNGCSSLKSIVIGRGITQISYSAFRNCTSMESLFIKTAIPPMLGNDAFTNNHCKIYVSIGSGAAYKAATNWSAYADRIYEYDF